MSDTTPQLRVVVIGGGVAGLSTAYYAARGGASVHVIEKDSIAAASSGLSAGIFNRQTFNPVDLALRVESGREFAEFERETSFAVTRTGYMRLARTAAQWERVVSTIQSGDYPDTTLIDAGQVAELVPGMRIDDVFGAMYGPEDGFIDGPELCAAFLELGKRHGVTFAGNTAVLGADTSGARITLDTSSGPVEADVVVNAAGAWLSKVGDLLGAPVGINNQRHEVAVVVVPELAEVKVPAVQTYFPGSGADAVYIRPEGPGRFLTGLHSYESSGEQADPEAYARKVSEQYIEEVAEALIDRFPEWEDASMEAGWAGIYPHSLDGAFIVGPHEHDRRIVTVGGLGGVGLTVSPAIGQIAADWVLHGESTRFDFVDDLLPDAPSRKVNA